MAVGLFYPDLGYGCDILIWVLHDAYKIRK